MCCSVRDSLSMMERILPASVGKALALITWKQESIPLGFNARKEQDPCQTASGISCPLRSRTRRDQSTILKTCLNLLPFCKREGRIASTDMNDVSPPVSVLTSLFLISLHLCISFFPQTGRKQMTTLRSAFLPTAEVFWLWGPTWFLLWLHTALQSYI